jgi:chromosome segregation ATPase
MFEAVQREIDHLLKKYSRKEAVLPLNSKHPIKEIRKPPFSRDRIFSASSTSTSTTDSSSTLRIAGLQRSLKHLESSNEELRRKNCNLKSSLKKFTDTQHSLQAQVSQLKQENAEILNDLIKVMKILRRQIQ